MIKSVYGRFYRRTLQEATKRPAPENPAINRELARVLKNIKKARFMSASDLYTRERLLSKKYRTNKMRRRAGRMYARKIHTNRIKWKLRT